MMLKEIVVPPKHERPCVYFMISEGEIVYVGQSKNVWSRSGEHRRWMEFDRILYFECDESQVDELERRFIFELKPVYNYEWKDWVTIRRFEWDEQDRLDPEIAEDRIAELNREDDPSSHISDRPITALGLSRRIVRRLAFSNIRHVSDIEELGANGLLGVAGLGEKAMIEIREVLRVTGIELKVE